MTTQVRKRIIDSIWGFAIGDALGVPYEFSKPNNLKKLQMVGHGTHNQPAGTWSDDTSLLLACLDSEQNIESLWSNYKAILKGKYSIDGKLFDIGNGTSTNLSKKYANAPYFVTGGDQSMGNGCLTRAIPYAAAYNEQKSSMLDMLRIQDTCLTHCNERSSIAHSFLIGYYLDLYNGVDSPLPTKGVENIPTNGYVNDSLMISLHIGLTCTSFDDGILKCINLGGDTDSHAAIVGSIAAIRFGGVPDRWLRLLRGKEMIEKIIDKSVWLK